MTARQRSTPARVRKQAAAAPLDAAFAPAAWPRAATALWAALALLALLRAATVIGPGMWGWGLGVGRFTDPLTAWLPWALAVLALVPAVGRRLEPMARRAGDALAARGAGARLACAFLGAALVWVLPDRVRDVGDFLLRQGTVEQAARPAAVYPQALPLDVAIHFTLPSWLYQHGWASANGAGRLLGAIEAAALAALAIAFARVLALRGPAALVAACCVFFGGALGLLTGYSKAFAEAVVLVAWIGVAGVRIVREGRGALSLGVATAIAVLLHRGMLAVLPGAALAFALALRARGARWLLRPAHAAGAALPVLALVVTAPRLVRAIAGRDAVHFASAQIQHSGGPLAAAFAGMHLLDVLNLVVLLTPLAPPALAVALTPGAGLPRRSEAAVLLTLALPFVGLLFFLHPVQGPFRDWDVFAPAGVALALVAAWTLGEWLRTEHARGALAAAIALAAAGPAVQWLVHHADVERGFARERAFVAGPPARSGSERAHTFDWLGTRLYHLERWPAASDAFREATTTAPSPRMLQKWAIAATRANDLETARTAYRRLLEKEPENTSGWLGLAAVTSRMHDFAESRRALQVLRALAPADTEPVRLMRVVDELERAARSEREPGRYPPAADTPAPGAVR